MLVRHNPVFVKPTVNNLKIFHGSAVVVRTKDGSKTSGEPFLYARRVIEDEGNKILLKWAYESRWIDLTEISGIAPRGYDTIEELEASKRARGILYEYD